MKFHINFANVRATTGFSFCRSSGLLWKFQNFLKRGTFFACTEGMAIKYA